MLELWHAVADPWGEPIMRRAFLEVLLLGLSAGPLGCWIVSYELSYSAESLAHSLFPGLVAASLLGLPLLLGAGLGVLGAALAVTLAASVRHVERDTAVGIVITTLFGAGVVLALSPESPPGLQGLLFGDVLGLSTVDLALAGALALVVLGGLWVFHGRLLAVGFDRSSARSLGAAPPLVDGALLVLLALSILVAVQGLGSLLAMAVVVGPAATARLLSSRMGTMLGLSTALAVATGLAGLYLSYYVDTAAGASIAGSMVAAFLMAVASTCIRGGSGEPVR